MSKVKPQIPASQLSRSLRGMKDWHAIVGIALLTAIFFRNIVLRNAFFWEDFMYFYYPARNFAAVSMAGGQLPLWNPFTFNGMPFQADIQTALFYIPNMILTLFAGGGKLSFYWLEVEIICHYAIAGISMYYLARSYNLERVYSFFSAVVFTFSGFMITRAIHQPMICETAWLPLIVMLFRKMTKERSIVAMLLCGIVLGHAILAGFPQLTLYIYFLLFLYFAFDFTLTAKSGGLKKSLPLAGMAAGVVAISLALAAIQLLPTIELAPFTQRAEMSYEKSIDGSLSLPGLMTLIVPKFFGAYEAQGSNYWMQGPYGQYWETCVYIGIAGMISLIFAGLIRRNAEVKFLFGIVIFSLLYALGDSFILHKLFFNFVPAFNKFREPGRLSFLWTFAASLLAGYGLRQFIEAGESQRKLYRNILVGVALAGGALWIIVQQGALQTVRGGDMQTIRQIAGSETTIGLVFILAVCSVMFLRLRNVFSVTAAVALLFALQFIDMHVFGFDQNNGKVNPDDYFNNTANIVGLVKDQGQNEYFRVNSRAGNAMILDRNQGMIDRIFTMEGYSSLVLQRIYPPGKDRAHVNDLLNAKYYVQVDEQRRSMSLARSTTYLPRAYMVYHTDVIHDDAEQKAFMSGDAFDPRRTVVLDDPPEVPLAGTDSTEASSAVKITSYGLNTIDLDVNTPKKGYLCLSEVYYPAWKAFVDDVEHPVYRANWNLRAIYVEAGSHHVVCKFESQSFRRGTWISLGTLGCCLVGLAAAARRKKSAEEPKGDL